MTTRAERIDDAVGAAGELIGLLMTKGPIEPGQARLIVEAVVRARVPNFEEWEIRDSATRIAAGETLMATIAFGELQRIYRARTRGAQRHSPRRYLIDGTEPSAATYQIVSRRLYAEGAIDNLGLVSTWISTATEAERAALFSDLATALLKV